MVSTRKGKNTQVIGNQAHLDQLNIAAQRGIAGRGVWENGGGGPAGSFLWGKERWHVALAWAPLTHLMVPRMNSR